MDLNDNAPIFEPGPYAADVLENATIGTTVLSATAQDLDSGDNGKVIYAIASGDDNNDFNIAPNGTVYTRKSLDRESKPLYSLVLSASDSPAPPAHPLSSTVQVILFCMLLFKIDLIFASEYNCIRKVDFMVIDKKELQKFQSLEKNIENLR